jgi:hypothetical protein
VSQVGLAVAADDPAFKPVVAAFAPARQRALAAFEAAKAGDGGDRLYQAARDAVLGPRRGVADAARRTAPQALPAQPAAVYLEEYAGGRFLAFARVDLTASQAAGLRAKWGGKGEILGAEVMTVFPALAWRYPGLTEGAVLVALGKGPLRDIGLTPEDVVLSVQGHPVADAASFVSAMADEQERASRLPGGGTLLLLVKTGDGRPREFTIHVDPAPDAEGSAPPAGGRRPAAPRPATGTAGGGSGTGVNIWDRTGGGNVRDNPDQ